MITSLTHTWYFAYLQGTNWTIIPFDPHSRTTGALEFYDAPITFSMVLEATDNKRALFFARGEYAKALAALTTSS